MMHKLAYVLVAGCVAIVAAVCFNTIRLGSRQLVVAPLAPPAIDAQGAAERLAGAVRLRTISYETPSAESRGELLKLHAYLAQVFPRTHAVLRREIVAAYSLLYTWTGQDPAAPPIVLMAHQDVVPVAPGTEGEWHAAPFSGAIQDGFVWGRGAWDDKGSLMAILEAVESLATAGFTPRRTLYLAFGHDEENGGQEGAQAIAAVLARRGVHAEFVLDEGLLIAEGILPGLDPPVALIGVAEKGSATLRLTASAQPGHSSMPGQRSAIGALATALERLEQSPMPTAIGGVAAELFATVAPEMRIFNRVALSNLWLFGPLVRAQLEQSPATNALVRTTGAITVIRGGNKQNVLPGEAEALVNFRLLPGDTIDAVEAHVRRVVRVAGIRIEVLPQASAASPVASRSSAAFGIVNRAVRELFPGVVVAPGLMIGGTDARHMAGLADDVYRFSPVRARAQDLVRFHGTDERIAVANYAEMIGFYESLIRHATGAR